VRREEIEKLVQQRPFQAFEVRLVGGRRFWFTSPEQLLLTRSSIVTVDGEGDALHINLILVSTLHVKNGKRRNGP